MICYIMYFNELKDYSLFNPIGSEIKNLNKLIVFGQLESNQ